MMFTLEFASFVIVIPRCLDLGQFLPDLVLEFSLFSLDPGVFGTDSIGRIDGYGGFDQRVERDFFDGYVDGFLDTDTNDFWGYSIPLGAGNAVHQSFAHFVYGGVTRCTNEEFRLDSFLTVDRDGSAAFG